MSRLLILQNRLKLRARAVRLTDHQRCAYDDIVGRWRYPERMNLYGPAGAGKTFLGWALADEPGAAFFAAPELLAGTLAPDVPVIIDNADAGAYPLRRLLGMLDLHGVRRLLLISRAPNPGLLPTIYLPPPTTDDVTIVLHNLSEVEFYALSPPESANLWSVVHATL